jgi:GNAT superfamily N-acetyltransferase
MPKMTVTRSVEGMGIEYTIRMATLDDVDTLIHHRAAMFTDMGFDPALVSRMGEPFRGWVSERLSSGEYLGWLALADGQVVAGAGLWLNQWIPSPMIPNGKRGYILNVYTEPEHRRQGLARRLVEACMDHCREQGLIAAVLHASDQGRPIYEGMGFTDTNEMRLYL